MEMDEEDLISALEGKIEFIESMKKRIESDLKRDLGGLEKLGFRLTELRRDGPSSSILTMEIQTKVPPAKDMEEYMERGIHISIGYVSVAHIYPLENEADLVEWDFAKVKPIKSLLKKLGYEMYKYEGGEKYEYDNNKNQWKKYKTKGGKRRAK